VKAPGNIEKTVGAADRQSHAVCASGAHTVSASERKRV